MISYLITSSTAWRRTLCPARGMNKQSITAVFVLNILVLKIPGSQFMEGIFPGGLGTHYASTL